MIALVLGSVALPGTRVDAADDFNDFRIPANRALMWTGGLRAQAAGQDQGTTGAQSRSGFLNGIASTRLSWFSDSDPALTTFGASLAANGTRSHGTSESQSFPPPVSDFETDEATDRRIFEAWSLSASHRRYPWGMPLGFEVSASADGFYTQDWSSQARDRLTVVPGDTISTTASENTERWRYSHTFVAAAAVDWGRVRNATSIYDALVLEQRLRETGAITRPLTGTGRQRLAEVLYLRGALDTVHERPGRALWREIERALAEDGALREDGLDPYSVLRAAEPHLGATFGLTSDGVPVSPVARLTGALVGLQLVDNHTNQLTRFDRRSFSEVVVNGSPTTTSSSFSSRVSQASDHVAAGPLGEIHVPLGPSWQLDGLGTVMLGLRKQENHLRLDSDVRLAWLAADRWTATANVKYGWLDEDRTGGESAGDAWQLSAGMILSWYLEDRTTIDLSAAHGQDWRRGVPAPTSSDDAHGFARSTSASIGVTYRFAGWIATPGFFPAATAIPAPTSP